MEKTGEGNLLLEVGGTTRWLERKVKGTRWLEDIKKSTFPVDAMKSKTA